MGASKLQFIPKYTYNDYLHWEGRWELIYGTAVAMSPLPSIKHQQVSGRIHRLLEDALMHCEHCQALLPVDWKIAEDLVLQPDNLVICGPLTEANFINRPPAIIFEIFSLSTALKDRFVKHAIYEEQGVKYYVWVEPEKNRIEVYERQEGQYERVFETSVEPFVFQLANCQISFPTHRIWQ